MCGGTSQFELTSFFFSPLLVCYLQFCVCLDGSEFDGFACRTCSWDSTGIPPNCVCNDENAVFIENKTSCYSCPERSLNSGRYPNCSCSGDGAIYNEELNLCYRCPENSTGVSIALKSFLFYQEIRNFSASKFSLKIQSFLQIDISRLYV